MSTAPKDRFTLSFFTTINLADLVYKIINILSDMALHEIQIVLIRK